MPLIVYKSQLGGIDFPAEVEKFRQALLEHRFTGDAAPHSGPIVEAAVRRVPCEGGPDDFVADYEIVDDTPPPPTLDERKALLVAKLYQEQNAALDAVMTAGKLRLLSLQAAKDEEAAARLQDIYAKRYEIELHGATVHAAIDDLPADQIDTFEIPAFPA